MKRNVFRRSLSLLLGLLVALGMTTTVFAYENEKGGVSIFADDSMYLGFLDGSFGAITDDGDDISFSSITFSNPNVASYYKKDGVYYIKGISAGKVTITCKYNYKGQEESFSFPFEVKQAPIVFKSLKINGKKVNPSQYPFGISKKVKKAKSVKIKAVAAPGWKVKSVYASAAKSTKTAKGYKVKVNKKMIKKGKKISFAKKYKNMIVNVVMVNTQTGESFVYQVQFYRNKPIVS